jgi:hypothetical protein
MSQQSDLINTTAFIHKIAVLAKDYFTLATTNDLFMFAGADRNWWSTPPNMPDDARLSRMDNVYIWIDGLKVQTPEQANKVLEGVAQQLIDDARIPQGDKNFLLGFVHPPTLQSSHVHQTVGEQIIIPGEVERLLEFLINGLPRAMFPLKFRREGLPHFTFENEYDVQSLFHALLRPWINDIRSEEYTPSYAGSSTRMDFMLPKYSIVCEIKIVRDKKHGTKIGDELIIDIAHYRVHPNCRQLWAVIYDPQGYIANPSGLIADLEAKSSGFPIHVFVLGSK